MEDQKRFQIPDEENFEENELKYRGLFQKMNQAFAIIQVLFDDQRHAVDYKFLEVNPAFEKQTGINTPIGKTVRELIPSIEEFWIETYGKVAITGESVTFIQSTSKPEKTYEVHAYKVDKVTDRIAIIFTDISERRKAEQDRIRFTTNLEAKVEERTKELERVNADLKRFAHVASHDLREPMRKVSTFNSLVREEYGSILPERALSFLAKIDSAIHRAKALIDGVHDYMSGDILLSGFEPVDLNEVIENIKNVLRKLITLKDARINVSNLPVIDAIPALIQRLFCNLIHNSLKFSRNGLQPVITIIYEPTRIEGKDFAKITVEDNGIGFDSVYSEKIFQPFTRLNPKDHYEGAGLGLAFCRKITYWHKGTITAKGQINEGASFYVVLPYKQEKD